MSVLFPCWLLPISIHALREEGDRRPELRPQPRQEFLSTPSARRATTDGHGINATDLFLSTPSVRRATALNDGGSLG